MARRVVSVISAAPRTLGRREPTLEANAFAVAADVDLHLVLRGDGVEHGLASAAPVAATVADQQLPGAIPSQDLRALVESGIAVLVDSDALAERGLSADDLVSGALSVSAESLSDLLRTADAVLTW